VLLLLLPLPPPLRMEGQEGRRARVYECVVHAVCVHVSHVFVYECHLTAEPNVQCL
jgi:hypothetical protein